MTRKEFFEKQAAENISAKIQKRMEAAQVVTKEEYIDKYFGELPETTKTFTIEVKRGNYGVYALRMPTEDFRDWLKAGENSHATRVEFSKNMKRASEARKPSVKFRQISYDEARAMQEDLGYELKKVFTETHAAMKKLAEKLGDRDVGVFFEKRVALVWHEEHIGEADRQSHTHHADTRNPETGDESECKTYTGWITCQYANEFWEIKG